jgi:GNAT superfamily N-acetyltransferase
MTRMIDVSQFRQTDALRDGTPVLIRAVRADDKERLVAAFDKLDPQTIYTRYFSFRKGFSATELERLEAADFEHFVALVVTLGSGAGETIIGAASYVVLAPVGAVRAAEVAFTVEEDYQGQGLAGKLLEAIIGIARSRGINRLEADVLLVNKAMLAVFRKCGLPTTTSRDGSAVHLVMDLATPAAGAAAP